MPWKDETLMSQRQTFIEQAQQEETNFSGLCRQFGISRKTGYKWLQRVRVVGLSGLEDRSRRPHHSPARTQAAVEDQVLEVRKEHPAWGGRKIRRILQKEKAGLPVPASSTITAILRRHDQINPEESRKHQPLQRFERERPNELWQMDFKGYFALAVGDYCHPLTVLDDHSRFLVGLYACPNETRQTVQTHLTTIFRRFGLPECMLMDNGSPWTGGEHRRYSSLTVWLLRLGIAVSHGRPSHPQTQGKDERLHRSLREEVLQQRALVDLHDSQAAFDEWWHVYNYVRPHEALQLEPPASHYAPSPRPFPEQLPPITYAPDDLIRKVDVDGKISFRGRVFRIGKAFRHQPVAIRSVESDGCFTVHFCQQQVTTISLREQKC